MQFHSIEQLFKKKFLFHSSKSITLLDELVRHQLINNPQLTKQFLMDEKSNTLT